MNRVWFIALSFCAAAGADATLKDALLGADASLNGRVFYFDRSFDKPNTPDSTALTVGGIAKLETKEFYGAKVGAAYYGSFLANMTTRKEGASSGLLEQVNGNNISLLGELYYEQNIGKSSFKIGRQRLNTPLANDHDLRLLPSSYEAILLKTSEIENNTIELGYIQRYTGFVSKYNTFKDEAHIWGKDGLSYIYLQNKNIPNMLIRGQYAIAMDSANIALKDYRYADASYKLPAWAATTIKAQYGGNDYKSQSSSTMYGVAIETTLGVADAAAVYNKIAKNSFKAIESGAMYTDWQQGYANYEPSEAVGGYITLKPVSSVSLKIGKVWVNALEYSKRDDFAESNIDFWYTHDKNNKLRIRYSDKDQSLGSTLEDRKDFRVAYYFSFAR